MRNDSPFGNGSEFGIRNTPNCNAAQPTQNTDDTNNKTYWRTKILHARQTLPDIERVKRNQALLSTIAAPVFELAYRIRVQRTQHAPHCPHIAAYVPTTSPRSGSEPGSMDLLDMWITMGAKVLLPCIPAGAPTALRWGYYHDRTKLIPGRYGTLEPEPIDKNTSMHFINQADIILVPSLAIDHYGRRLGRGGGYYDRSLPLAHPASALIGCVDDNEFFSSNVPYDDTDVLLDYLVTPYSGLRPLHRLPRGEPEQSQ